VPEGHTIHHCAREHRRLLKGRAVAVSSPQGRFSADARLVDGQVLVGTDAFGKHLFHDYANGLSVHVHLGIYGEFHQRETPPPIPRDTTRMRLLAGPDGEAGGREGVCLDLIGPTQCHVVDRDEKRAIAAKLGPDPLRKDADPERAWAALQRRKATIGAALMDQGVFAGVGNVFRAEALFVHGIHPETPANQISREQFDALWSTLTAMLRTGLKERRIMTVDAAELGLTRRQLTPQNGRYVYRQEHCLRCGTPVRRWDLAGRWSYACETCQPR
jgi:endonuclease-8